MGLLSWKRNAKPYTNPHRISGEGRAIEAGYAGKGTSVCPAYYFAKKNKSNGKEPPPQEKGDLNGTFQKTAFRNGH